MAHAVRSSDFVGGGRYSVREVMPMAEINTTPLIDVMLVLLIMFIITVPMQTDKVPVDLPKPGTTVIIEKVRNNLGLSPSGLLSWNGQPISDAQLAGALADIAASPKPPEVHFKPDAAARYERVDQVLAIAARSGASTFGFSGNEQYRDIL
jgi:biopolymer transport protein ExbD